MTRYFVNETEIPSPPPGISSLDEVLKHVEKTYLHPGSAIRQVLVDGRLVLPDALEAVPCGFLNGFGEREKVEITTGSLLGIARDSVTEAVSYLGRIESAIPSLAAGFQAYPGPEAFENLKEFYTGFYWLNLLLERLKTNFAAAYPETTPQGVPLREHQEGFISILKQLVDAQERGDFVLIADLLEYEILPVIPVWKEFFEGIARNLGAASET